MSTLAFIAAASSTKRRGKLVVPREYFGDMCGTNVPGLPAIETGRDSSLVVSWIVDRYDANSRNRIYARWRELGHKDILVSWPDSRERGPEAFLEWMSELVDNGFLPSIMFCSKDFDARDVTTIMNSAMEVIPALIERNLVARACVGWELSLWLSPTQVQYLIDAMALLFVPAGVPLYIHLQQGYGQFGQPDEHFHVFWERNVGKLTGLFHQRILGTTMGQYRYDSGGLYDILIRFGGDANTPTDSGFGHPFDLIGLEITAQDRWNGNKTEDEGREWGRYAIETPSFNGVRVMGSGNGF